MLSADDGKNPQRITRLDQLLTGVDKSERDVARLYLSAYSVTDTNMGMFLDYFKNSHGISNIEQLEYFITKDMTKSQYDDYSKLKEFNSKLTGVSDINDNFMQVASLIAGIIVSAGLGISIPDYAQTIALCRGTKAYTEGFMLWVVNGQYDQATQRMSEIRGALNAAFSADFNRSTRLGSLFGTAAQHSQFLPHIGMPVKSCVSDIKKITDPARQKEALFEAIPQFQIARLSSTYFLNDAVPLATHISKMSSWMQIRASGAPGFEQPAYDIAREIAGSTAASTVEETQSKLANDDGEHYSDDDADESTIVAKAILNFH